MPSLINAQPSGLLSILGINSVGQNPSILPDVVTPTVALDELYVQNTATVIAGSTSNIAAVGYYNALTPSGQGEAFYVSTVAVISGALAAGTTYRLALAVMQTSTGNPVWLGPESTITAGELVCMGTRGPLFVPNGYSLGLFASRVVLGTATFANFYAKAIRVTL